jgi:hypothetical protein
MLAKIIAKGKIWGKIGGIKYDDNFKIMNTDVLPPIPNSNIWRDCTIHKMSVGITV